MFNCINRKLFIRNCTQITRSIVTWKKFTLWYRNFWRPPIPVPPYRHAVQIGDPVLRFVAQPVDVEKINTQEIIDVIKHLKKALNLYNAVGMSAPQIGIPLRIFVMKYSKELIDKESKEYNKQREIEQFPMKVFINPKLKVINYKKVVFSESCESVRGFSADVPRYHEVELTGLNEMAEGVSWQVSGWPARIIQHEMDHLDGQLYTDIMIRSSFECSSWNEVNRKRGELILPFVPPKFRRLRLMVYYS